MLPSPIELKYFSEVASTLSFSRASEKLGMSQPSLSLAIRRLEKTIGVTLFSRHKYGVTLTHAGKELLLHLKQLLQYWENTKSQVISREREIQGHYTIGCHTVIANYLLSKCLPDLLENYPKLSIHLKHDISRKVNEEVIDLSIDIGVIVNPHPHPDLIIRKLFDDEFTFWVGEGSREIQNIHSNKAILLCDPDLTQTQILLKKCKKLKIAPERMMTMNSLEVVANLTKNGGGIGILPSRVANLYPGELSRVSKAPAYSDEVCLVYRHENRHVQAVQCIINSIKNFVKKDY